MKDSIGKNGIIFLMAGFPKELGLDNGREFNIKHYSQNLSNKNIKEVHGLPRKHHSQGPFERAHQIIVKDLISKISEKKN